MSARTALQRFFRSQVAEPKKKKRVKPPCPWKPTPIEMQIGGFCKLCGYPTSSHRREK